MIASYFLMLTYLSCYLYRLKLFAGYFNGIVTNVKINSHNEDVVYADLPKSSGHR